MTDHARPEHVKLWHIQNGRYIWIWTCPPDVGKELKDWEVELFGLPSVVPDPAPIHPQRIAFGGPN